MRSLASVPLLERLLARRRIDERGCWRFIGSKSRYGYLWYKGRMRPVHRLAASIFLGIREDDPAVKVLHRCDVPDCFNPRDLFLGNQSINMLDAVAKGRFTPALWVLRGAASPLTKLTAEARAQIRELRSSERLPLRALAQRYGVSVTTIFRALNAAEAADTRRIA